MLPRASPSGHTWHASAKWWAPEIRAAASESTPSRAHATPRSSSLLLILNPFDALFGALASDVAQDLLDPLAS